MRDGSGDGWQDTFLSIGQFAFAATLIPTIIDPASVVPLWTSFPTALILFGFTYTYITLGLGRAAISCFVAALAWTLVAALRHPQPPPGVPVG